MLPLAISISGRKLTFVRSTLFWSKTQLLHIVCIPIPTPQTAQRVSTVAGPDLPELPPGGPKFVLTQVKEMDRLISRIEKEDSYDMFRSEADPINKLKGTGTGSADAASGGGGGGGRGQPPRRRSRKGAGAGAASDDGMDIDIDHDGQEGGGGVKKEQLATEKGGMVPFKGGRTARGATRPRTPPPINLPQIRERFVSGNYLPAPGSYLIEPKKQPSESTSTAITPDPAATSSSTPADATAASNRSQKNENEKDKDKATTSRPRSRSASPLLQQGKEDKDVKEGVLALAGAAAGSEPASTSEQDKDKAKEKEKKEAVVVALTEDSCRLGPNAKLTFDYEPLLDWPGLRADVVGLATRLVQGAEDWRAEKEHARNQRRQRRRRRRCKGGGGGGSDGDEHASGQREGSRGGEEGENDEDDEGEEEEWVDEYLENARKFASTVEELVTKQLEKAEKDVRE